MDKWPNFFIVGAPKAGTSSLYAYLKEIKGIYMSPIKEPNYFSISTIPENHRVKPIRDKRKYLALFEGVTDEKIVGEASTSYLSDSDAPHLIKDESPNARILISLRNPIDRTYSYYAMLKRLDSLRLSFHEELERAVRNDIKNKNRKLVLKSNIYFRNVQRYFDIFGKKDVKIIIFEEFIKDPRHALEQILEFLEINCSLDNFQAQVFNKSGTVRGPIAAFVLRNRTLRRFAEKIISPEKRQMLKEKIILKNEFKPEISNDDKEFLRNFFQEDVFKLEQILKRRIPWKEFRSLDFTNG